MYLKDRGVLCGSCLGRVKSCSVCDGRGRLYSLIPKYEREKIAEIIKSALENRMKVTIQLTRAFA